MRNQKVLETLADISYLAGQQSFFSGDSRSDISEFIRWANEFEKENTKTDWDSIDYISAIEKFTEKKIKESIMN